MPHAWVGLAGALKFHRVRDAKKFFLGKKFVFLGNLSDNVLTFPQADVSREGAHRSRL